MVTRMPPIQPLMIGAVLCLADAGWAQEVRQGPRNVPEFAPAFGNQTRAPEAVSGITPAVETVAAGLAHPWGMALLPDGAMLVTERPGRLRVVEVDGTLRAEAVAGLPEVFAEGQGGLLDVAVGPDFAGDRMVYWTYARPMGEGLSATAVARGRLSEDLAALTEVTDLFVQDPPSPTPRHYGSRIVLDGAGGMFVTTGEHSSARERGRAQDLGVAYGKVLRLQIDGTVPPDNPFVGEEGALGAVWSYGHRNIQGAALEPGSGALWISEHGPKGGDEVNRVRAGANYGWPVITYGEEYSGQPIGAGRTAVEGMEQPVYYWDPVIAPSGMLFYQGGMFPEWQGDLLVAALSPGGLVRLDFGDSAGGDAPRVVGEERLLTDRGRVRDVAEAADGSLLVLIDAVDGAVLRLTTEGAQPG